MAKTPKTSLIAKNGQDTGIVFSGKIDLNDVANIAVSRAETQYTKGIADARKKIAANEKAQDDARASIEKATEKVARDKVQTKVTQLDKGLKGLNAKTDVVLSQNSKDETKIQVSVQVKTGRNSCTVYEEDIIVKTAPIVKQRKQLATLVKNCGDLRTEALDLRKKLSNISMLERQVRAKISEQKLSEHKDGKAILKAMSSDLDDMIKFLPGA